MKKEDADKKVKFHENRAEYYRKKAKESEAREKQIGFKYKGKK